MRIYFCALNLSTIKKVTAQLFIKAESQSLFKEKALQLVKNSREEEGCSSYGLFQSLVDKGEFVFIEEYVNQDALDIHFKADYLKVFIEDIATMQSKEMIVDIH